MTTEIAVLVLVAAVWLWYLVGNYGGSVLSAIKLPWSGSKEISPEEALRAMILLKAYFKQTGNEYGQESIDTASRELLH